MKVSLIQGFPYSVMLISVVRPSLEYGSDLWEGIRVRRLP